MGACGLISCWWSNSVFVNPDFVCSSIWSTYSSWQRLVIHRMSAWPIISLSLNGVVNLFLIVSLLLSVCYKKNLMNLLLPWQDEFRPTDVCGSQGLSQSSQNPRFGRALSTFSCSQPVYGSTILFFSHTNVDLTDETVPLCCLRWHDNSSPCYSHNAFRFFAPFPYALRWPATLCSQLLQLVRTKQTLTSSQAQRSWCSGVRIL
jgi:hypothetical protein